MYKFNTVTPPLLRENADIVNIPLDVRREGIGAATFIKKKEVRRGDAVLNIFVTDTVFNIRRYRHWEITTHLKKYSRDEDVTHEVVEGYTETHRSATEKFLEISVNAEVPFLNLDAGVKANLKLNDEVVREWKKEKRSTVNTKFLAGNTYVGWTLFDTLSTTKISVIRTYWGSNRKHVHTEGPIEEKNVFSVILKLYDDKLPDSDGEAILAMLPVELRSSLKSSEA